MDEILLETNNDENSVSVKRIGIDGGVEEEKKRVQIELELAAVESLDNGLITSTPPGFVIGLLEALNAVNPDGELASKGQLSSRSGLSLSSSLTTTTTTTTALSSSSSILTNAKSGGLGMNTLTSSISLPSSLLPHPLAPTGPLNKRPSELALDALPCEFGAPLRRRLNASSSSLSSSSSSSSSPLPTLISSTSSQKDYQNLLEKDFCALRERVALDLVLFYANRGDVQTSVTIARVLSPSIEEKIGKRVLQKLNVQYIDLLHRLSLWSAASTIMSHCSDEGIRRINQQSTSVLISCGMCGKDVEEAKVPQALLSLDVVNNIYSSNSINPQDKNATGLVSSTSQIATSQSQLSKGAVQASANPRCRACKHIVCRCSICQEPVRGLYTWCQGCGHGGDRAHMMEWFETLGQTLCPTGCGHFCTIKDLE